MSTWYTALTVVWPSSLDPLYAVEPATWVSPLNETIVSRIAYDRNNLLSCDPHPPLFFANATAVVLRGNCSFGEKVLSAYNAGALAVICYDSTSGSALTIMESDISASLPPAVFVSQYTGLRLLYLIDSYPVVTVAINASVLIDTPFLRSPQYDHAWITLVMATCMAAVYWVLRCLWTQSQRRSHVSAAKRLKRQKYRRRNEDVELALTDVPGAMPARPLVFDMGSCPICIDDFDETQDVVVLPCGHIIHPKCIEPWFDAGNDTCPLCKAVVLTPDPAMPETACSRWMRSFFSGRTGPAIFTTIFFLMMVGLFALFFS